VYGVLVWPPEDLRAFMEGLQAAHGVRGFGPPHMNLRQPFDWPYEEEALKLALLGLLRGQAPFRVRLGRWGYFPQGVVYLRAYGGRPFQGLYQALEALAPPLKEIEGPATSPTSPWPWGFPRRRRGTWPKASPRPRAGLFW
jgi:2'-5' RNA ligase